MKNLIVGLLLMTGVSGIAAELEWKTDFEAAKKTAKAENKALLVNFSGSDWCGWCKRLNREVFSKKEFKEFAEKELVLVVVDFPRYKKQSKELRAANAKLQRKFLVSGFPAVFLVSAEEEVLLKTGYVPGGPANYIKQLKSYMKKAAP